MNMSIEFSEISMRRRFGKSMLQIQHKIHSNATTIHKIFETNSSFHVKYCTTEKFNFCFSKSFLVVLTKFSFWQEDWALGYHSIRFRLFPDIS